MHLILFPLLLVFWQAVTGCPPADEIAPACLCKNLGNGPMMACSNIYNPDELIAPIHATKYMRMFSLTINNSSLRYIPSGLFLGTTFHKILFIGTEVLALSDSDKAFVGLEDELQELRVFGTDFAANWEWSQLRDLRSLNLIDIAGVSMHSLGEPFPPLKSLGILGIEKAEISFVEERAFSELKNIGVLALRKNNIKKLERSMLPNPAEELIILDLSNNQLSSLPEDFFQGMPELQELNLDFNNFVTLNELTFNWPMKHVHTFTITGNKLRCDCRMRWMTLGNKPLEIEGTCEEPEGFKGKELRSLYLRSLKCPK